MSAQRHALLGLFFVSVIGILSYFTLFKTDFKPFAESIVRTVYFNDANGLRKGDAVQVAGMRWGKVSELAYDSRAIDQSQRIRVGISLNEPIELFADHKILVQDATVLGGKVLLIEPGTPDSGDFSADVLYGEVAPNVLNSLAAVVDENREALKNALAGVEKVISELQEGTGLLSALLYDEKLTESVTGAIDNIRGTFENASELTNSVRTGDGTLSQLIYERTIYDKAVEVADDLQALLDESKTFVADVRAGSGAIGALIYDEEVEGQVREAVQSLRDVSDKLNRGEGTIGKLLNDPTVADNLKTLSEQLTNPDGTLGRLLNDSEMYDDLQAIATNLRSFSDSLENGEGTITRLVKDPELYEQVQRAMTTLTGSLEEAREAAPISTFLSTLFLGF